MNPVMSDCGAQVVGLLHLNGCPIIEEVERSTAPDVTPDQVAAELISHGVTLEEPYESNEMVFRIVAGARAASETGA